MKKQEQSDEELTRTMAGYNELPRIVGALSLNSTQGGEASDGGSWTSFFRVDPGDAGGHPPAVAHRGDWFAARWAYELTRRKRTARGPSDRRDCAPDGSGLRAILQVLGQRGIAHS